MATLNRLLPKAWLELEVRDGNGKTITRRKQRAHSWVRNLYNLISCVTMALPYNAAWNLNLVDRYGTSRTSTSEMPSSGQRYALGDGYRAGAGVDDFGILVGSGTLAFDFEQYALESQIMDGVGAGQFSYVEMEAPTVETVGTTKRATYRRFFNNNSGATITVGEIGLFCYAAYHRAGYCGALSRVMVARDVLATPIDVPDAGQLRVTYIIELPYPASGNGMRDLTAIFPRTAG